ncbi:MAG TPA: hypothetical protein DCS67_07410 [Clostridiales bacterium UBA8960]|jgi:cell division protein FtsL|nr:hypothetical protein [Clostridiales bacterium UBA8960]
MKKRKAKFIKRNWLIIIIILIVGGYYTFNMIKTEQKLAEYHAIQEALKAEIESLEREINRLVDEYAYSQTPDAIEKIAREKLKMVKPNEIIYLIKNLEEGN